MMITIMMILLLFFRFGNRNFPRNGEGPGGGYGGGDGGERDDGNDS